MTLTEEAQKKILELEQQVKDLQQQLEASEKNAATDHLTGIFNRRVLEKELNTNLADADRSYFDLVVVEIDLDHFKDINDVYGHQHGDKVLIEFTRVAQDSLRDTDTFGRWGGEEFLMILPIPRGTHREDIEYFLKRLHSGATKINRSNNPYKDHQSLTVSSGAIVIEAGRNKIDREQVLRQVDAALYESKKTHNTYTLKAYQTEYLQSPDKTSS